MPTNSAAIAYPFWPVFRCRVWLALAAKFMGLL
jgi:hypothetical protein